jgi:hypothetical protein
MFNEPRDNKTYGVLCFITKSTDLNKSHVVGTLPYVFASPLRKPSFLYPAQSLYEAPLMQISGTPFLSLPQSECFLQLPSQIDRLEPTKEREAVM